MTALNVPPVNGGYVCYECKKAILAANIVPQEELQSKGPVKKPRRSSFSPPKRNNSKRFKTTATSSLEEGHYPRMFRSLLESHHARVAFDDIVTETIKKERCHQAQICRSRICRENERKGEGIVGNLIEMPDKQARQRCCQRVGTILSIILYSHQPLVHGFIQTCIGTFLWMNGCSQMVLKVLHAFGLSRARTGTMTGVNSLRDNAVKDMANWKAQQIDASGLSDKKSQQQEDSAISNIGYTITHDNVQLEAHVRHQCSSRSNVCHIWDMAFMTMNLVKSPIFDPHLPWPGVTDASISLTKILPDRTIWESLRRRMIKATEDILATHFLYLPADKHPIPHDLTKEMSQKSEVRTIGVLNENPSSMVGMLRIMEKLMEHVPNAKNGIQPVVCFGDGLSVDRMRDCQRLRLSAKDPVHNLRALVACPQEFHRRGLLTQDTMNALFSGKSICDRGTLFNLKQAFNHRQVKGKVMHNFNHVNDFLKRRLSSRQREPCHKKKFAPYSWTLKRPECCACGNDLWYCSEACVSLSACCEDGIQEYAKAVLYSGLRHRAFRSAVRAGNGPFMMNDWRVNVIDFWSKNHYKYLKLAHELLININGFQPPHIAFDMVHNRKANVSGMPDRNIGLDLYNEFKKLGYKEMLKQSHDVYSDNATDLCAHLSGAFKTHLENVMGQLVEEPSRCKTTSYVVDIPSSLFKIPNDLVVRNPYKLSQRLQSYAEDMDDCAKP
ncbi:hypothetical protein CAPTEDRAFT_188936 [Capitella teleta]|uniref:DUF6589 domain-containing protein n=1 Tax=Capitella teleta TaxID=283909 RepID=R7UAI6_CAPTE|nr:hypothetical protein CAPTEDRAFT_188936 [Capitella teleta]|eukprot:ELU00828.1 hypothetical protein CAPTEDRAFT_188936 [Capitella teleta]